MITRVGKSQLSNYQSLNHPNEFMPIDIVADLETESGQTTVSQALSAFNNAYLVPCSIKDTKPVFAEHLAEIGREFGDVMGAAGEALSDGRIDARERDILLAEINQSIHALASARAFLEGIDLTSPQSGKA